MSAATHYHDDAAGTASIMDVDAIPPTSPDDAPTGHSYATTMQGIVHATLSPLPRSARALPAVFSLSPTLSPQPSIESWIDGMPSPTQALLDVSPGTDDFRAMRDVLASQTCFSDFVARASSSYLGRVVASELKTLDFLDGSSNVAPQDIPSVDLLHKWAPSVNTLSINAPFGPSLSPQRIIPDIQNLCVDEGNTAVWSANRTAATLAALRAPQVRELCVRNATLRTVTRCMGYLGTIRVCILVDDDAGRHLKFIDQHGRAHTYDGAFVGGTPFLFINKRLADLEHLTVDGWMLEGELQLLFGLGFPARLKTLHIGYACGDLSLDGRAEVLAYRHAGQGRCEALEALRLTTTRPLVAGVDRGEAPPVLPVERSLINAFLKHIHGREVVIGDDVRLELDGMTVSPEDRDRGSATLP